MNCKSKIKRPVLRTRRTLRKIAEPQRPSFLRNHFFKRPHQDLNYGGPKELNLLGASIADLFESLISIT